MCFTRRVTGSPRPGRGVPPPDQEELHAILLRAVRTRCPPALRSQAEDLAHTAWLRILERYRGEDFSRLEPSYFWKVAFTVIIDEIRRRAARESQVLELAAAPEPLAAAPDLALEIRDCLGRLPESRQLPVILHLQGLRHVEVARALGSTEKRVENLVYRGLEQLRRCLEGKGQVTG